MATTQERLDQLETVITKRLAGDGYEEYSDGSERFRGASLTELFNLRDRLLAQLASESGGNYGLLEPFCE